MSMDPDMMAALASALEGMSPVQSDEFRRRFTRLCENALTSNHNDSEVRRVLQLIAVDAEGEA